MWKYIVLDFELFKNIPPLFIHSDNAILSDNPMNSLDKNDFTLITYAKTRRMFHAERK